MRRYSSPERWASHWVSVSMSSAFPSLARRTETLASRTSGCCTLSAWAQRATVRCASSGVISPSSRAHSTRRRQSIGPWCAAARGTGFVMTGFMAS